MHVYVRIADLWRFCLIASIELLINDATFEQSPERFEKDRQSVEMYSKT